MNEYIKLLTEIDIVSFLLAFFTIAAAIVTGRDLMERLCAALGIKLTYLEEKRKMQECQTTVKQELKDIVERQDRFEREHRENMEMREEFNKEILGAMSSLKDDFKNLSEEIDRREAEKRFKKLRFDILNMADRLCKSESITNEMILQVLDECNEYTTISHKYNFENDRVTVSMKIIKKKYEQLMLEGKVISEAD